MSRYKVVAWAVLLAIAASAPAFGAAGKKKVVRKPLKKETLACRLGTEDRHARIAVVLVGGKTDSFAYYSKWKPRTCSIFHERNRDAYSKWADNGNITTVSLEKGAFLIEHKKGVYHFTFREIDRERYCGMDGVINGALIIKKGSDKCVLEGEIMAEGAPLGTLVGGAVAKTEIEPEAGATDVAKAAAADPAAVAKAVAPEIVAPAQDQASAPAAATVVPTVVANPGGGAGDTAAGVSGSTQAGPAQAAAAATQSDKAAAEGTANPLGAFFRALARPASAPSEEPDRP